MVHVLRSRAFRPVRVAGSVSVVVLAWFAAASRLPAEPPPVHYWHAGAMPPGAIGGRQLLRGGPLPGYFQPVDIIAPDRTLIFPAIDGRFDSPAQGHLLAGMLIGSVYRLCITNIGGQEGADVYPTIEVIDRLYPPNRQERQFPVPIEITQEELEMALDGKFVTRVIYVEEPQAALPATTDPKHPNYFEAAAGDNPLDVADQMGRPIAILRMGGRVPEAEGPDSAFLYGSPPLLRMRDSNVPFGVRSPACSQIERQPAPPALVAPSNIPANRKSKGSNLR